MKLFDWFKNIEWKKILNPVAYVRWLRHQDWKENWRNMRQAVNDELASLQASGKALGVFILCAFLLMGASCVTVFFLVAKGQEEVMVPEVTGKKLADALIEMQEKELYPKIQLRYSDDAADAYTILEQSPEAGAIVKAGRRINLVVSRGVILDHVENYVGMGLDDLRIKLQTIFAGSTKPLIVLGEPMYKADKSPAGTILAQNPPEGTQITDPVRLELVVSRGLDSEAIKIPDLTGKSIEEVLKILPAVRLTFDFDGHIAAGNEQPGTVSNQQRLAGDSAIAYTRIHADIALPESSKDTVSGIFSASLPVYPFANTVQLVAQPVNGDQYTVVSFKHPGGSFTVPYTVPKGTTLILNVAGKDFRRVTVQ